ncbi:MAG TPA: PEP-CTERM sorting domain-containing protein [Phycisphaerae bacterium]|nr:PEP-CTERM sorting domain-containing protein [Phycisphaerae bacterium]
MRLKLWMSLVGVVLCAGAAEASIHQTWQIDVSGTLNGNNDGQITVNSTLYADSVYADATYQGGINVLGLAYNGTFTGTITLETQYKESEYTPGEYEMDRDFAVDGWRVTGAVINLPTALGGTRTFAVDFSVASHDSYRQLGWFTAAGELTQDFPNGHPEIYEALRYAFPAYEGPGGYYDCSYLEFASQSNSGNVWAALKWYEDVQGTDTPEIIVLGLNNITMEPHVVPEPATMAFLVLGGAALICRRRK